MVRLKNSLFYSIIIIVISSITSCSEFNYFTSGILIEKAEVVQL